MKQRDEAHKIARLSKSKDDWEVFRQLRNKTVDICRTKKRGYLEERIEKNKKDPKNMWKVLKELVKGKRNNNKEYKEIQCGNTIIYKVEEMTDIFNCYFVDSIRILDSKDHIDKVIENRRYSESIWEVFKKIGEEQLYEIVRKLENKAGTEEGISTEVMKCVVEAAAKNFVTYLTHRWKRESFQTSGKKQ